MLIGCRMTGIRFWSFADALAPGLLVAQAVGRLGNWFNHELFGLPTDLPWGLEIESTNPAFPAGLAEGTLFHPTFLYEIIWNLAGAALIILLERRINLRWGKAFASTSSGTASAARSSRRSASTRARCSSACASNVWASWAAVVLGIVLFLVQRRRHTGDEPTPYVPGREWKGPDAEVDSDETESDSDSLDDGVEGENSTGETAATSSSRSTSDVAPHLHVLRRDAAPCVATSLRWADDVPRCLTS